MSYPDSILPSSEQLSQLAVHLEQAAQLIRAIAQNPSKEQAIALDQQWFWTPEWQAKHHQAIADVETGHMQSFENVDNLIVSLQTP